MTERERLAVKHLAGEKMLEEIEAGIKDYTASHKYDGNRYGAFCFSQGFIAAALVAGEKKLKLAEYKGVIYEYYEDEMTVTEQGSYCLGVNPEKDVRVLKFKDGRLVGVTGV